MKVDANVVVCNACWKKHEMKNNKSNVYVIVSFGLFGLLFYVGVVLQRRVFYLSHYFLNTLVVLFYICTGLLFARLKASAGRLSKRLIIAFVIFLFCGDQISKYALMNTEGVRYPVWLVFDWLLIQPEFNPFGSYVGSIVGHRIPLMGSIEFLLLFVIVLVYRFFIIELKADRFWGKLFLLLCMSGSLCSFIDTVLFGSSYDFITLNGMIKFDSKDLYIWLSRPCLVTSVVWMKKGDQIIKDFRSASLKRFIGNEWIKFKNTLSKDASR